MRKIQEIYKIKSKDFSDRQSEVDALKQVIKTQHNEIASIKNDCASQVQNVNQMFDQSEQVNVALREQIEGMLELSDSKEK